MPTDAHNQFMKLMSTWLSGYLTHRGLLRYPERLNRIGVRTVLERIWGNPRVTDPPLLNPRDYIDQVSADRIANLREEFTNMYNDDPQAADRWLRARFTPIAVLAEALVRQRMGARQDYIGAARDQVELLPSSIRRRILQMSTDPNSLQPAIGGPQIVIPLPEIPASQGSVEEEEAGAVGGHEEEIADEEDIVDEEEEQDLSSEASEQESLSQYMSQMSTPSQQNRARGPRTDNPPSYEEATQPGCSHENGSAPSSGRGGRQQRTDNWNAADVPHRRNVDEEMASSRSQSRSSERSADRNQQSRDRSRTPPHPQVAASEPLSHRSNRSPTGSTHSDRQHNSNVQAEPFIPLGIRVRMDRLMDLTQPAAPPPQSPASSLSPPPRSAGRSRSGNRRRLPTARLSNPALGRGRGRGNGSGRGTPDSGNTRRTI